VRAVTRAHSVTDAWRYPYFRKKKLDRSTIVRPTCPEPLIPWGFHCGIVICDSLDSHLSWLERPGQYPRPLDHLKKVRAIAVCVDGRVAHRYVHRGPRSPLSPSDFAARGGGQRTLPPDHKQHLNSLMRTSPTQHADPDHDDSHIILACRSFLGCRGVLPRWQRPRG
jgi:hypothetical protein